MWLNQNQSGSHWDLFYLLRKWAEAIGEGLKECIKREKEVNYNYIHVRIMYIYNY